MMTLWHSFNKLKWITLAISWLTSPLWIWIGFCLGTEDWLRAGILWVVCILFGTVDFFIGWQMFKILIGRENSK